MVLELSGFSGPGGSAGFSGLGEENLTDATANSGHAGAAVWQARALQAEERASQAIGAARTGLTPHLGRLLKHRLIAWLSSQRSQLLTSHEVGTQQVLELEERLVKIQGDFQERLRSREERITNLEQEILVKEKTIRDLLRAQVRMANESSDE